MSLIFWKKNEPPDSDTKHEPARQVNEQHALPVGIYYKRQSSQDAAEVADGYPLPVSDLTLLQLLAEPIRYAASIRLNCAAAGNYAAGDVLSNSATDGLGLPLYVPSLARTPGGVATIMSVLAKCNEDAVLASLRLHFFRDMPLAADVEMDDNVAYDTKTETGRWNHAGSILLSALADRGTAESESNTEDIRWARRCAVGETGLWMVVTTEIAEANETANMIIDFEFYAL